MSQKQQLTMDHVVHKSESFIESNVDGETILMGLEEGSFSALRTTGLKIWALIDGVRPIQAICDHLIAEFDVERVVCEAQTMEFLQDMRDKGLVELRAG